MTYCVGISLNKGLVLASDSRTNAGADQVRQHGKMHTFGIEGERQFVLLSAGNLATTQAVITRIRQELRDTEKCSLCDVKYMNEIADYVGKISQEQQSKFTEQEGAASGFSPSVTFILGGQIKGEPPSVHLIYPEGNHITTSRSTPYLQAGEVKYGKPILDRIIRPETSLEDAARCAVVSMDSTMQSNVTVGPPIELLIYEADSLQFNRYLCLEENDPYLMELRDSWAKNIRAAFDTLPDFNRRTDGSPPS
jgi:putative proteasome-type protease